MDVKDVWLISIIIIIASVIDVMIINRGITNSCLDDIILASVLLVVNLGCLVIMYKKVK